MSEEKKFDVAIIGGGPGGYVAAIRAAQMGKSVALIEKGFLGGTCLNVGCIPTKALLAHAHLLKEVEKAPQFGIDIGSLTFDYAKMVHRKDLLVQGIRKSLEGLILSNKITIISGHARFLTENSLSVEGSESCIVKAASIIIATGSSPVDLEACYCDHQLIRNSTSMLTLTTLPKTLTIIGGGYIGCEFATLYSRLGVKVTIIEVCNSLLANQEKTIQDLLARSYERRGISVLTNAKITKITKKTSQVELLLEGQETPHIADILLVAVGRTPQTEGLDLEKIGIKTHGKGCISVNEKMETNIPNIYAVGDVVGKWMLAHVASHQGIVAADTICGKENTMTYHAIPAIVYSYPEIASVGLTQKEAEDQHMEIRTGKYPFKALGKSLTSAGTEGFAFIIADKKTEKILGAHLIGDEASTLIGEMTLAIQNGLTLSCITHTLHAHPSLPEALLEASFIAKETPLHFPPQKPNG